MWKHTRYDKYIRVFITIRFDYRAAGLKEFETKRIETRYKVTHKKKEDWLTLDLVLMLQSHNSKLIS